MWMIAILINKIDPTQNEIRVVIVIVADYQNYVCFFESVNLEPSIKLPDNPLPIFTNLGHISTIWRHL